MSNDSEPPRKGPSAGVMWPTLVVAFLGVFAYLTYKAPLRTARPKHPSTYHGPGPRTVPDIGAVHARLWEDPLEAAFRGKEPCIKLRKKGFKAIVQDSQRRENRKLLFMPILVPGAPYAEDREQRMDTRYAVLAALGTLGYKLPLGKRMSYFMVDVTTDFRVLDDEVPGPIRVPVKLYQRDITKGKQRKGQEYYGGVLLCWLNEAQLGDRPLNVVAQIADALFPDDEHKKPEEQLKKHVQLSIIGPSDSDTLLAMLKDDRASHQCKPRYFSKDWFAGDSMLFSPRATVWEDALRFDEEKPKDEQDLQFDKCGLKLVRAVGTDRELVEALCVELKRRGAWPGMGSSQEHLLLITERDTLYGRALPSIFGEWIPKTTKDGKKNREPLWVLAYLRGIDGELPATRAADQKAAEPAAAGADRRDLKALGAEIEAPEGRSQLDYLRRMQQQILQWEQTLRREHRGRIAAIGVVGTDVYDKLLVLRALRKHFPRVWFFTTDLDAAFAQQTEYRHTRNLLVASHFGLRLHDDLQRGVPPFRDSYQTATFFAMLLALKDQETLEALSLDVNETPDPWGVNDESAKGGKTRLPPLVFEIGRHGPYQLTMTDSESWSQEALELQEMAAKLGKEAGQPEKADGCEPRFSRTARIHPSSPRTQPRLYLRSPYLWLVFGGACILVCIAHYHSAGRRAALALWRALYHTWILALWILQVQRGPWLVRVAQRRMENTRSAGLRKGLAGIANCWTGLAARIRRPFEFEDWFGVFMFLATLWLVVLILFDHRRPSGEPFALFDGISIWPSTLLRFAVVVLSLSWIFSGTRKLEENHREILGEYFGIRKSRSSRFWRALSRPWWEAPGGSRGELAGRPRRRLIDWPQRGLQLPPFCLYRQYLRIERPWRRWVRIAVLSGFYLLFGASLFVATDWLNLPYRGWVSRCVGLPVAAAAVLAMILLVFFVLDATHFCRRFLRKLAEGTSDWPKRGAKRVQDERGPVEPDDLRELLTIRLIANRTRVVGRLMYAPCFIIFLLLVSRHPFSDNWNFSWPLLVLATLSLGGAVLCAIVLRIDARKAREDVLRRLRDSASEAVGPNSQDRSKQLALIIREVENEKGGAFGPWSTDPLLGSLAVPFAGAGGVVLLQQVLPLLQ